MYICEILKRLHICEDIVLLLSSDYGANENQDLAERFGVKKEDYPAYKLFLKGQTDPVSYTGNTAKADEIKKFIVKETGWLYWK